MAWAAQPVQSFAHDASFEESGGTVDTKNPA